jgi:3-oxoacyl-(acyl-carrier-protein) synthase
MLVAVEGYALLGSFGCGAADLIEAIEENKGQAHLTVQPSEGLFPFLPKTDTSKLTEFFTQRALRQIDHFTRMALLCVSMALKEAPALNEADTTGIILATGYGAAGPTFDFMDSVLQYGEDMASPLAFSHSVQNIPAAIIARQCGFVGPCMTVCQPEGAFAAALTVASLWLEQEAVQRVILVGVDEQHPFLPKVVQHLYDLQDLPPESACYGIGEGAAAIVLAAINVDGAASQVCLEVLTKKKNEDLEVGGDIPCALSSPTPFIQQQQGNLFKGARGYGVIPVAQALDVALHLAIMAENPSQAASGFLCASTADNTIIFCQ